MAFCKNCGINLDEGAKSCTSCGTKTGENAHEGQNPYAPPVHDSVPISGRRNYIDYGVIQTNRELRACARKQLQGVWGQMALAIFVCWLISFLLSFFSGLSQIYIGMGSTILTIAVILIGGPFALGFAGYFLKRIRDEEIALKNIFDGFKCFIPSILVIFFMGLFVFLWSLLLIIPGIIKALDYSMSFFIMYDNPEIKPLEALKKSQIMMKGYKLKLFCLFLSFIGWFLLVGLLTLGIGFFWLGPYFQLSGTNFYENLKETQAKATAEAV